MSYTTIKAVYPGKKTEDYAEFRNSWGSAPVVWAALASKYLGLEKSWLLMLRMPDLWALWNRADIPEGIRAVLMMTFDRAYVTSKDYARASRDIKAFLVAFPPSGGANHWAAIAELFDLLEARGWRLSDAATDLGVSTAAVSRLLERDPAVLRAANERRAALDLRPLRA